MTTCRSDTGTSGEPRVHMQVRSRLTETPHPGLPRIRGSQIKEFASQIKEAV